MKRTTIFISMLVLLLSLGLVSCDAMFETNLFAGLANKPASADEIAAKSPSELQDYISGDSRLQDLAADSIKKDAALGSLKPYYDVTNPAVDMGTSEAQTAAIVAAEIAIKTVPDAAGLSGSILAFVSNNTISTATTADVTNMVAQVLPKDIADTLTGGGAMPQAFSTMIDAFVTANGAFQALGAGIAGATPAYADGTSVSSVDKQGIAVNAVIAGLLSAITPTDPGTTVAEALWIALSDPTTVDGSSPNPPPIAIDPATFSNLIGTSTGTPSSIANLLTASGLGDLFSVSSSTGGV